MLYRTFGIICTCSFLNSNRYKGSPDVMIILRFVQGVGTLHPGLDVHLGLVGLPGAAAAEVRPHEAQRTPGLHVPGRGFPGPIRGEHPTSSPPITAHLVWLLPLLPAVMGPTGGSGGAVAAAAGDILLTGATLGSETGGGSEQSRAGGLTQAERLHAPCHVRTRDPHHGTGHGARSGQSGPGQVSWKCSSAATK